jgi:hypothetical protein
MEWGTPEGMLGLTSNPPSPIGMFRSIAVNFPINFFRAVGLPEKNFTTPYNYSPAFELSCPHDETFFDVVRFVAALRGGGGGAFL